MCDMSFGSFCGLYCARFVWHALVVVLLQLPKYNNTTLRSTRRSASGVRCVCVEAKGNEGDHKRKAEEEAALNEHALPAFGIAFEVSQQLVALLDEGPASNVADLWRRCAPGQPRGDGFHVASEDGGPINTRGCSILHAAGPGRRLAPFC